MARKNYVEMYSAHNGGKSVVFESIIKILKNKIYKYMTSVSKYVYFDKLGDIVKKYNNIKMKSVDVKSKTYINFNKENNYKDPKFKVDNYVRISKYEINFAKCYVRNWSGEDFII